MRLLPLLLLFSCTLLTAQNRPLTYFSQVSFGRAVYTEVGKGIIDTGDINGDSIADMAFAAHSTFQVGYGRIENEQLYFDMQAIDFLESTFFYSAQIIDVDSDGDLDYNMTKGYNTQPQTYTTYKFDNQGGTIQPSPAAAPSVFPSDKFLHFGAFNDDEITDAFYRVDNEQVIMDGSTGEIHKPFPPSYPLLITGRAHHIDMNGDGLLDFLLRSDNFPGTDTIEHELYINQGNFDFLVYGTRGALNARDHGDFDGDGILDIIGNSNDGDRLGFGIKTNLMTADLAEYVEFHIEGQSYNPSMLPYDLNEDGYDDLVVFTEDTVYYCQNNQDLTFDIFHFAQDNEVYLHFASHPSWPNGTVVGEGGFAVPLLYHLAFDGTNFSVAKSSATITPPVIFQPPYYHRMTALDTDMDGLRELGINSGFELLAAELENDEFQEYTAHEFDIAELPFFSAVASADFNNDDILDLVFTMPSGIDLLQICYGQPDSTFSAPNTLTDSLALCFKIGIGDFDNNGFIDLAASGGLGGPERFSIFFNQDGTQFIEHQLLDTRHEAWNIIDPNADGIADLAISKNSSSSTKIYMNDGQGMLDSTQIFSGRVTKSNITDSPFLFLTSGNLIKIDPTGTERNTIGTANISANTRTAYKVDYNLDGLPDLLYSDEHFNDNDLDTTYVVLADTMSTTWEVRTFPGYYVHGVEDIDGDGTEDILWQIGSQLWVELINTPAWSEIVEQEAEPLRIFPNPVSDVLQFGDVDEAFTGSTNWIQIYSATGQLVFSKKQNENKIDVSDLERGAYFLVVKSKLGEISGGSFIRM